MQLHYIRYQVEDEVAFLTLNRPENLNALNPQMLAELDAALDEALADTRVNAILLAGEGRAFCAGWDIKQRPGQLAPAPWERRQAAQRRQAIALKLWRAAKPVLCAVQGYCFGDGYELANQADLLMAADDAVFSEPQVRFGWVPAPLTLWLVGVRKAKEKLLLGDRYDAEEARRIGLVNWVVPCGQLAAEARRRAIRLAHMPTETMQLTKRTLNQVAEMQGYANMSDWHLDVATMSESIVPAKRHEYDRIEREQGFKQALAWLSDRFDM
jgi:enoyl-CoA hydratase